MKKKPIILAVLIIASVIAIFILKYNTMILDSKASAKLVSPSYPDESAYSNLELLVKKADNIFVGEVLEQKGSTERLGNPAVLYEVRVTHNVKGGLLGGLTIIQEGGYYKQNGKLHFFRYKGDELLQKGEIYLFAVIREGDSYWTIPVYGHEHLKTEQQKQNLIEEIKALVVE
ncbi:hypothetical protein AM500_03715 [Bacillus sp. FJAT-18017]|uniref:hypothetical protein n=1 Tax=Bacillus sp. FJAT-18017 TaxID=1705566 RepID=UPI0006AEEA8F|nr:hypothetical protein [Bacillus sp. FJAT-18017]ALC89002.1 hypothetical protein AM500_03715 [Bacillus sp. FJAT-18017]